MTEREEAYRERQRECSRRWYYAHREEAKERNRKWKAAHMDRCEEYNRRYREQRAEQRIEKKKAKAGAVTKKTLVDSRVARAVKFFKSEDAARHAAWLIEHRSQAKL